MVSYWIRAASCCRCINLLTSALFLFCSAESQQIAWVKRGHACWIGKAHPAETAEMCCDPKISPKGNVSCWWSAKSFQECCRVFSSPMSLGEGGHEHWRDRTRLFGAIFRYLEASWHPGIKGDYVELGVFQGSSAVLAATQMVAWESPRNMWLYDSWQGLPEPDSKDPPEAQLQTGYLWNARPDLVERDVLKTGFPLESLHIRPGFFNVSLADAVKHGDIAQSVAVLHLDCDWHSSVLLGLQVFYDRVVDGGIVVIDDFGHWPGARIAFYEFFNERGEFPLLERVGYTIAWFVKGKVDNNRFGVT